MNRLLLVVLAIATATAARAASPVATGKDERPARLGPAPATAPFDCGGAPVIAVRAGLDTTLAGDTTAAANLIAGYGCVAWNESGGEAVWKLSVAQDLIVTAILAVNGVDHDVFLLTECDGASCVAAASTQFGARVAAGEFVLIVDGFEGAAGPFTLSLRARAAGIPESICEGGAIAVLCATTAQTFDGNIFGQPDHVVQDPCSPYLERGGEVWYAVTLADSSTFTARVTEPAFDAAIWVFADCGPQAQCLGFADANVTGGSEELVFHNESGPRRTVYLAVDGLRPAEFSFEGSFSLGLTCSKSGAVPRQASSWGAVKSAYR